MELERYLNLNELLQKKSFFLFGPRATGKTTLIKRQFTKSAKVLDLLNSRLFLRLSSSPHDLEALIEPERDKIIVIDEIQRIPELLNEVHRLIEDKKIRFLLTGSSARKLRRGKVNLLAGRAWSAKLFPLIRREIPNFDLERYLRFGGLPAVYLSDYPEEELDAYINTYLREEIAAEGLIRKLPPFSRFLKSMALANSEIINFTKLANDCEVSPSTITEYVSVLEDTLVGFMLPAWTASKKRKALKTAKFYFFDPGVTHTLRARLVNDLKELEKYPYSGHSALMGKQENDWQDVDYVLGYFGSNVRVSRRRYREYVKKGIEMGRRPDLVGGGLIRSVGGWKKARALAKERVRLKGDERILGDSDFVMEVLRSSEEQFERKYRLESQGFDLSRLSKRVAELLEVDPECIYSPGKYRQNVKARSLFCYWGVRELGMTATSLARTLGMTQPAVSISVKRGQGIADENGFQLLDE